MDSNDKQNITGTPGDVSSGSSNGNHSGENKAPIPTGAIKKKREEKRSKRDQRSWDNLIKSLGNLPESEKLDIIKEKYSDLYTEFRTTSTSLKNAEKTIKNLQREKEHVQTDLAKNILSRSKLENLARELQKQNREIKEENFNRLKEEEEKRREVASNFSEKLNTLTQLMDENKDKSLRLREENINMTSKLTDLYDRFQERETHLANMNKQMELQRKLSETQIKKIEYEFETEKEIWKKDRTKLIMDLQRSDETNKVLQENIKSLQQHLDQYQKQYSDFETTMKRSNKVFDSFKEEMTKMQKANSVLEKDRNEWHGRWKGSTQKCLQLTELSQTTNNELKTVQKKLDALEKLCRKLQAERSYYLQQLKIHNITPMTPVEEVANSPSSVNLLNASQSDATSNSSSVASSSINKPNSSSGDYLAESYSTVDSSRTAPRKTVVVGPRGSHSEPDLNKTYVLPGGFNNTQSITNTYTVDFDSSVSEMTPNSTSDLSGLAESPRISNDYIAVSSMDSDTDLTPNKEEKTEKIEQE